MTMRRERQERRQGKATFDLIWSSGQNLVVALGLLASLSFAPANAQATEIGAYRGPGCDGRAAISEFEAFLGRKVERTVDALNQTSWLEMRRSIPWITKCWAGSGI